MNARLAYRINALKPQIPAQFVPGAFDAEALKERLDFEVGAIQRAPKFCADNVASFYAVSNRTFWDVREDIPNWAPPFEEFFVEWNHPSIWRIDGKETRIETNGVQVGFLVGTMPITNENRTNVRAWQDVIAETCGYPKNTAFNLQIASSYILDPSMTPEEKFAAVLAKSRWLLILSRWGSTNQRPLCGNPIWCAMMYFIFVAANGELVYYLVSGPTVEAVRKQDGEAPFWAPIHIFGLMLSFCHCKNVRVTEDSPSGGGLQSKQPKGAALKFHTLQIGPMREILTREGRSETDGLGRALHICRGHFATYTPDSPLFGKYVGTFWRPDHVRGNASAGTVVKDYGVMPTEGKAP